MVSFAANDVGRSVLASACSGVAVHGQHEALNNISISVMRCCCFSQDDMKLAVDFFPYFEMGAKLLDRDPSLYCISSWNDHGQAQFVQNSTRLERSDFFPGLGWMLTNSLWQSLK